MDPFNSYYYENPENGDDWAAYPTSSSQEPETLSSSSVEFGNVEFGNQEGQLQVGSHESSHPSPAFDFTKILDLLNKWQTSLQSSTVDSLKSIAITNKPLSQLNTVDVFYYSPKSKESMIQDLQDAQKLPTHWFSQEQAPGLSCSVYCDQSLELKGRTIVRVKFTCGYSLYDPEHEDHRRIWNGWKKSKLNSKKPNAWDQEDAIFESSVKQRINTFYPGIPDHREFYQEYAFGGILAKTQKLALVILEPCAIQSFEVDKLLIKFQ